MKSLMAMLAAALLILPGALRAQDDYKKGAQDPTKKDQKGEMQPYQAGKLVLHHGVVLRISVLSIGFNARASSAPRSSRAR